MNRILLRSCTLDSSLQGVLVGFNELGYQVIQVPSPFNTALTCDERDF